MTIAPTTRSSGLPHRPPGRALAAVRGGSVSAEEHRAIYELRSLRLAQAISAVGSWIYSLDTKSVYMSDELLSLFDVPSSDVPPGWSALTRCIHPNDQRLFVESMQALNTNGTPLAIRFRVYRNRHGSLRWCDARGTAQRDESGRLIELAGTVTDVTELVNAELELRKAHADLVQAAASAQAVISATPDVIHVYSVATGELSRASTAARPLIGFTDEAVRVMSGLDCAGLVPADYLRRWDNAVARALGVPDGEVVQISHPVLHADGTQRWLSRRLTPFERGVTGAPTKLLVVTRDDTASVTAERQLEYAALHDELTGLPNRRMFRARVDELFASLGRAASVTQRSAATLVCDLDGFKRVNDVHGHLAGDAVLREVARRLIDCVRHEDLVARIGGDEFAILISAEPGEDPETIATHVAQRITTAVALPIAYDGREHRVTASVGTRIMTAGMDGDSALSDADSAMYFVKHSGANGHALYQPTMRPSNAADERIERELRRALTDGTVGVGYQPIVDPRTHRICGVEALLRLRDSDGEAMNAADVIRLAEARGLVIELDEAVRRAACAQVAQWRDEPDLGRLTLNVNCSAQDIARAGFGERIDSVLADTGLDPQALTIEITETVLLDASQENLRDLRALRERGVGLAIDDFGTGYASLRYLADLPITCIKLDRSFTRQMLTDTTSQTLVRATVGLAEQLGINCTAEGIETPDQLDALPEYARLRVQGYIFAAALEPTQAPPAVLVPLAS